MKKEITGMMACRIQSIKLTIKHVRYPGQRMPMGSARGSKGPDYIPKVQARVNIFVGGDIEVIVKTYKFMADNLSINDQGGDN